tara:strand:- start:515 stop:754 length:240 start_codon:yes stop_codon:yes gene_type:complete
MELRLKEGVFGFTWNYETGELGEVFTEELSSKEIQLIGRVMGDDVSLVLENRDIEFIFGDEVNKEELEEMGLDVVLEFV